MTARDFSAVGSDVLAVEMPLEVIAGFEQPDDGLPLPDDREPYRAFVVPAEIVNRFEITSAECGANAGQSAAPQGGP